MNGSFTVKTFQNEKRSKIDDLHECAENVGLPEAVRFVHQLTDLVVIEIQLVDLVVLAARRSRLRIG